MCCDIQPSAGRTNENTVRSECELPAARGLIIARFRENSHASTRACRGRKLVTRTNDSGGGPRARQPALARRAPPSRALPLAPAGSAAPLSGATPSLSGSPGTPLSGPAPRRRPGARSPLWCLAASSLLLSLGSPAGAARRCGREWATSQAARPKGTAERRCRAGLRCKGSVNTY